MLPSFARRGQSYHQPQQHLEPDFEAAFGSDDEDEQPLQHRAGTAGDSTASNPDESADRVNVPGSYDFEQPTNQSAPAAPPSSSPLSTQTATRPSPSFGSLGFVNQLGNTLLGRLGLQSAESPTRSEERESSEQSSAEAHSLLFSHDGDGHDTADSDGSSYPPRNNHIPLPSRPPVFAAQPTPTGRVFGGGQGNDGVFANLSAKPDGNHTGADYVGGDEDGPGKDEVLPAYEVALADTTPAYWETTVITPGGVLGPDDICVDGLPVGSLFAFAWSLLVSMSFQFIGKFTSAAG